MQGNRFYISNLDIGHVPSSPGVYLIHNSANEIIYVGKSSSLRVRLGFYFSSKSSKDIKTTEMVSQADSFEIIQTRTTKEALLLEHNLIKKHLPRYNVLLKDGKSYPYLLVGADHDFPKITMIRSNHASHGNRFGPYPNVDSAWKTLEFIQKFFKIRNCDDHYFKSRKRPCMQYEIKRCSAPCMGFITQEDYADQIQEIRNLLSGKPEAVISELVKKMEMLSEQEDFESAGLIRDMIKHIQSTIHTQAVEYKSVDLDVLYFHDDAMAPGVQILQIRNGKLIHAQAHDLQNLPGDCEHQRVSMISQYLQRESSNESKLSILVHPHTEIPEDLQHAFQNVNWMSDRARMAKNWIDLARINAQSFIRRLDASREVYADGIEFENWSFPIESIVCFDVSHHQGGQPKASMVYFKNGKPLKKYYRHYKLDNITPGDDYEGLRFAVSKALKSMQEGRIPVPNVWVIDGGRGQLNAAYPIIERQVSSPAIISICKGRTRHLRDEKYFIRNEDQIINVDPKNTFKRLICFARDESHRFALLSHRKSRNKKMIRSELEDIPGIGKKKTILLMNHFGGIRLIKEALIDDLRKVKGIDEQLAIEIYKYFHGDLH